MSGSASQEDLNIRLGLTTVMIKSSGFEDLNSRLVAGGSEDLNVRLGLARGPENQARPHNRHDKVQWF